MDFVEVGNVSTTSGFGLSGHNDEAALLLKSIVDNKISFQQGKTLGKMCESLRRHARRSAGVDLRDYTDLDGLLPMTNVLASLPKCLAPAHLPQDRLRLSAGLYSLQDRPPSARRHVLRGRFGCVGGHARLGRRRVRPARGLLVPPPQPSA